MKRLKRNLDELFEKGISFIRNIKKDEKTFLIYHKDVDGMCSASILFKVFEIFGLVPTKVAASSNEEMGKTIKTIKFFDKTIILDIDIAYLKEDLEELDREILLIDHHPPRFDLNNKKIVYINPRLEFKEVYQPVSYIVFKLFSRVMNLKDVEWTAILGTIGDKGFEDCKDLVEKLVKLRKNEELAKTVFWKDVRRLNGSITTLGFDETLSILRTSRSLTDLRKNSRIRKAYREFTEKYNKLKKDFWNNAIKIKDANLIISEIGNGHRALGSFLSTNLAMEHPNTVIILMRKLNGSCAINARYEGENLGLNTIIDKCAKGLNGGGGHPKAAGGTIKLKNKEIFKKRLIKELVRVFAEKS